MIAAHIFPHLRRADRIAASMGTEAQRIRIAVIARPGLIRRWLGLGYGELRRLA